VLGKEQAGSNKEAKRRKEKRRERKKAVDCDFNNPPCSENFPRAWVYPRFLTYIT
jgi:hypothetical protein